ncbi:peroxidase 29 [Selaginella moellendorffii]|uniref:peroxidase 29 n=1 Tax=Selaginella moellendorffii TaxID=88036 RepID=UPI000D1C68FA|nr:peroxidase 29 [Selaginella moellendorffii]|eukprot:XP_024521701.1 peroxidase 29 [Selaginella moellendorffii]
MASFALLLLLLLAISCRAVDQESSPRAQALGNSTSTSLRLGYYGSSCPNAETIVRQTLMTLLMQDPTAGAALLRLAFHDCDVMGCDASIILDSTAQFQSELESPKNFGIRRVDFIDRIKASLEGSCPRTVSCADIIALAARDSILLVRRSFLSSLFFVCLSENLQAGGPNIPVLTGRKDSTRADLATANRKLATATSSVEEILQDFASMGINPQEAVSLLGAHTLGVGHCLSVVNRLYPSVDTKMDLMYSMALRVLCPSPKFYLNITAIPNDSTMFRFDNMFFKDAASRRVLFALDAAVQSDPRTSIYTSKFAQNQGLFFDTFSRAFVKLTSVVNSEATQVRSNCRAINS